MKKKKRQLRFAWITNRIRKLSKDHFSNWTAKRIEDEDTTQAVNGLTEIVILGCLMLITAYLFMAYDAPTDSPLWYGLLIAITLIALIVFISVALVHRSASIEQLTQIAENEDNLSDVSQLTLDETERVEEGEEKSSLINQKLG